MDVLDPAEKLPPVTYAPLESAQSGTRRVWTVFVAFALALSSALLFSLIVTAVFAAVMSRHVAASRGATPTRAEFTQLLTSVATSATGILGGGLASCLSFAFFALVCASMSTEIFEDRLRLRRRRRWFAWGLVGAIGMLGIGQAWSGVMVLAGVEGRGALGLLHRAFAHPTLATIVSALCIVGVGAGVGEELFFRGYMQTRLAERWGPWAAVFITAALFGLVHFDPWHSSFAFLVGLLVGWLSLRAGTIRVTIVAHVTNNLVGVASMALTRPDRRTPVSEALVEMAVGVAMIAVCALAFRGLDPDDVE